MILNSEALTTPMTIQDTSYIRTTALIDIMQGVKVSCENVMNHIPLTFVNDKLCLKKFSFHPFMIHENNISEVNLEPIIIKISFY